MSYTSNIPLSGESLGSTRDRINQNFQQIDTVLAVNHVAFNDSGEGKHTFLQMPEQASAPATAVNEGGFYTKVVSGNTQFFMRNESSGSEYQISGMNDASFARFGAASATAPNGWTFLPGGLILQWGRVSSPGTSGTVTFATANRNFPTAILYVHLTLQHTGSGAETYTLQGSSPPSTTQFVYRTSSSGASSVLFWSALGY